jgi:hypothetical protein
MDFVNPDADSPTQRVFMRKWQAIPFVNDYNQVAIELL